MWPALRAYTLRGCLLAGLLTMVGALSSPQPAFAQPAVASPARAAATKKAREHFDKGQRLFTVSRYREALEEFKEAFVTVEDPVFLYNIAQCHRLLGEKTEAVRFYRRYAQSAASAADRARAEKWIAELEASPGAATASAPATSRPPVAAVTPPPSSVSPPSSSPSSPSSPPPTSSPGAAAPSPPPLASASPVEPAPVPYPDPSITLTPPPPEPAPPRPIYKRWWFWAGVGAGVILGSAVIAGAAKNRPLSCGGPMIDRCTQL